MLKACIGLNCARTIDFIDHRHCSLTFIPDDVYRNELTLEELLLDCNMLQELPAKFFRLTNLRKLTLSENDLIRLPPNIANFTRLIELDVSKNAIEEIPQNMQFCRSLSILELSSNPLLRTPLSVSSISSLTQLYLNDVSITELPPDIGNLSNLHILEARENMLKTLPRSIKSLKKMQRLDVGNNEIETLPDEVGALEELVELWLDDNTISELPQSMVQLSRLVVLDITKNKVEKLPDGFSKLSSLADLHASENCIEELPADFGNLKSLHLVKLDYNHLRELPESIGKLEHVTELLLYDNMLESLPTSLFQMKSLEMLNVDRNHLMEIPASVGQCRTLHVLSMRENELTELPEELGQLEELTVLDVVGNRLNCLPLSVSNLHLDALWIDNSQAQPLVALHPEIDSEQPDKRKLTCVFLPQQENFLEGSDTMSESQSVTNSLPREKDPRRNSNTKTGKLGVAFDPSSGPSEPEGAKLVRFPTPFRRDMKNKKKKLTKYKPDAIPSTTIFKKGTSQSPCPQWDDLTLLSVSSTHEPSPESQAAQQKSNESLEAVTFSMDFKDKDTTPDREIRHASPGLAKMSGVQNLASTEELPQEEKEGTPTTEALKNAEYTYATDITGTSQLQTIEVTIELKKQAGKTLGFSIAGGRGSTPAYEDVDESIFVTKIAGGGLAEIDGRLRLGDKLLKVNDVNMSTATHTEAVAVLKNVKDVCRLVVSREVLVVMPDEKAEGEEGEEGDAPRPESPSGQATPTAADDHEGPVAESPPTIQVTGDAGPAVASEGQNFAKRIVAEILDRSVTKFRHSLIMEGKEEQESGGKEGGEVREGKEEKKEQGEEKRDGEVKEGPQHDNYINYDIAQTLLVTSRVAAREDTAEEEEEEEGEGSKTPTETGSPHPSPKRRSEGVEVERGGGAGETTPPSSSPIPVVDTGFDEEEYEIEKVTLDRSVGKLGLSIIGGSEHASRVFGGGRPGIYVSKISKGGAAEACGQLRLGDRLLAVNGQNVRHSTHQQAVQWLVSSLGNIELLVEHVPQPPGLKVVIVTKSASAKLGISIKGGTKSAKGNPLDSNDNGIFISKITKGAAAEADGRLSVGQRILEVNGTSLLGATHLVAVRALRNNPMEVSLLVCDGYDPREVVKKKAEQERLSINASMDTSSLSSEASRSLDDAVRILSESMDILPSSPQMRHISELSPKLSRSSADIIDRPVTAEDLDDVLKGLAKFKDIESPIKSAPELPEPVPQPPASAPPLSSSSFSSDLFTLQSSDLPLGLMGEDIPDISLPLVSPKKEDSEGDKASQEVEDEFSGVQVEDTNSFLAQLDSEVSHLQDEVLEEEGKLEEEEEKAKEEAQFRTRRRSSHRSTPRTPVAPPPEGLTPEIAATIMEEVQITVEPPEDPSQQKEALESLIGEVFDDVSFDEFEQESIPSGGHSGYLTPSTEAFRAMSPDPNPPANMQELLSALKGIGTQDSEVMSKVEVAPPVVGVTITAEAPAEETKEVVRLEAAPPVENVSISANTKQSEANIKSLTLAPSSSPVQLRVHSGNKDPSRRRSAPPKVAEKPVRYNPEKMSFQEKLALHRKTLEQQETLASTTHRPPARPSSAREGNRRPVLPELGVNRTSSAEAPAKVEDTETEPMSPQSLSGRISALQISQSKSGMLPVGVKTRVVQSEESKMSAEERRLERILSKPTKFAASAQPSSDSTPTEQNRSTEASSVQRTVEPHPKENGEMETEASTPRQRETKTTTIIIPPSSAAPPTTGASAQETQQNNSTVERLQGKGLPPSVIQFLADMPPPPRAPDDSEISHSGEEAEKWEEKRAWREEKRKELEKEVQRVEGLLNDVSGVMNKEQASDTKQ